MNDTTFQGDGKIAFVPVVVNAKPPKQTNADRIRSMTDEELADWLVMNGNGEDYKTWLDWLRQEAKDD